MKSITNACLKLNARERPMLSLHTFLESGAPLAPSADSGTPEPASIVVHAELEAAIERGLSRLPETQRAAIELKALGHSLEEIAEILGVTPSNAGVLIFRGRQALARRLAPYLEDRVG
jgi:RNA polymerase sigma-70 factor (ECF subfamily)